MKIPFGGETVLAIFDSTEDAVEFLNRLKSGPQKPSQHRAVDSSDNNVLATVGQRERPLAFLMLVKNAGRSGIPTKSLVRQLGLKGNRSVGAVVSAVRNAINKVHLEEEDVLRRTKRSDGDLYWIPGPQIDDAISAIGGEEKLKEDRLL